MTIVGRLVAGHTPHTTSSGIPVTTVRIATNERGSAESHDVFSGGSSPSSPPRTWARAASSGGVAACCGSRIGRQQLIVPSAHSLHGLLLRRLVGELLAVKGEASFGLVQEAASRHHFDVVFGSPDQSVGRSHNLLTAG